MILMVICGCGRDPYEQGLRNYHFRIHNNLLGAEVGRAEEVWGRPQSITDWGGNLKAYRWQTALEAGSGRHVDKKGRTVEYRECVTVLLVNTEGRIVNYNPTPEDVEASRGCGFLKLPEKW